MLLTFWPRADMVSNASKKKHDRGGLFIGLFHATNGDNKSFIIVIVVVVTLGTIVKS